MAQIPIFPEGSIEALARLLGECGSGTDIMRVLAACGIPDDSQESTKWRRLYVIFLNVQKRDGCANKVVHFIQSFLTPARFVGRNDQFKGYIDQLNVILAFSGFEFGLDGVLRSRAVANTLDEAEKRVQILRSKFSGRPIHPETLKYCKKELLADNYFHAVFEAAKGLAQRIRELAAVGGDGAALVDQVFSIDRPLLAFNSLRTESEKSEHKGFAMLLKGCFGAVRNPLAHDPKILWQGEDDAADYLTLISLLHRKLDACVKTGLK